MSCNPHTSSMFYNLKIYRLRLCFWTVKESQKIWLQSWAGQLSVTAQSYRIIPNNPQLVQDGQSGKEDVADERNDSQFPIQLPSVNMNRHKKKDDGKEECAGNEDQSSAVDLYRVVGVHKGSLDEPR